ncbi:hypothetical protein ACK8GE_07010 [Micromonosporaceae bacterium DT194]|uniref:hypothetical protein n=1 Tax=Melissospora conviva TaxID=3388432 RepID=UPI003C16082A
MTVVVQNVAGKAMLSHPRCGDKEPLGQLVSDVGMFPLHDAGNGVGAQLVLAQQDQGRVVVL